MKPSCQNGTVFRHAALLALLTLLMVSGCGRALAADAPVEQAQPAEPPQAAGVAAPAEPGAPPAGEAPEGWSGIAVPEQATPIMPLADVRIGMRGYGMTVFRGARVEPFAIEVIAVVNHQRPGRAVIWVLCDDERLDVSGPVQGMSGSPMYLWPEGQEGQIGEGGLLVGAFAFGYSLTKEALVGVQPIEYMRQIAGRVAAAPERGPDDEAQARGTPGGPDAARTLRLIARSGMAGNHPVLRHRLEVMTRLVGGDPAADAGPVLRVGGGAHPLSANAGLPRPMRLPLGLSSESAARVLQPVLESLDLSAGASMMGPPRGTLLSDAAAGEGAAQPVGLNDGVGVAPPAGMDADDVLLGPGSVVTLPLAFGDGFLAASGTVTEVLPDGTVLAFGHAMLGQGEANVPMATGFAHHIVSLLTTSFRPAAGLRLVGTLVQDEASGVVGVRRQSFETSPVTLDVHLPSQPARRYAWHVVQHEQLTPAIVATVVAESAEAVQALPALSTVSLDVVMRFQDGEDLAFDTTLVGGQVPDIVATVLPVAVSVIQSPFGYSPLASMHVDLRVQDRLDVLSVLGARLVDTEVRPGETLRAVVQVQPYDQAVRRRTVQLPLPADLPAGDYVLHIGDAVSYAQATLAARPHLAQITSRDELLQTLRLVLGVEDEAMYVWFARPEAQAAVGRQAMPGLPDHVAGLLAGGGSASGRGGPAAVGGPGAMLGGGGGAGGSGVQPYQQLVTRQLPQDSAVSGVTTLPFTVRAWSNE